MTTERKGRGEGRRDDYKCSGNLYEAMPNVALNSTKESKKKKISSVSKIKSKIKRKV